MKLKFRLLLIIILLPPVGYARQKWAFLVGISNYDTALTSYQWNNINGIEDVNLLSPILFNQGFSIITLLDKEATYKNIVTQLSDFSDNIKKGDIVYLHFSAHGQPVEDTNGDEEDGWDEAIVPIDAYKIYKKGLYDGNRHLIDDQLNKYVKRLREKIGPKGFLYVTIDACHAGKRFVALASDLPIIIRFISHQPTKNLIIGLKVLSRWQMSFLSKHVAQTRLTRR